MCKLSIPNDKFISMNSPFQNPNLFSSLRDAENNFEFFDSISQELCYLDNVSKVDDVIEGIDEEYGIRLKTLRHILRKRKDNFSLPTDQNLTISIYFYVDTIHDLSYMFNVVFNDGYKSIGFELCPRDCAECWTEQHLRAMDKLGDLWSRNQQRIAYIKEHETR